MYLYSDGTFRTLDINQALFNGKDVADYICAAQPETWSEWEGYAEDAYKEKFPEDEEVIDEDGYAFHERPSTLF